MTHIKGEYKVKRQGNYIHERLEYPGQFQKGSFRTVREGDHRIVIGRRLGHETTSAQAVLHPSNESVSGIRRGHAKDMIRRYLHRHQRSARGEQYKSVREQGKRFR